MYLTAAHQSLSEVMPMDFRGNLPVYVYLTDVAVHDVKGIGQPLYRNRSCLSNG